MSLNEVSIKIPGEYIPNVFGQFDAFAKKIERTLHVTLVLRDDSLKIIGAQGNIDGAKEVFEQLIALAERGNVITEQNVNYALALLEEHGYFLSIAFSERAAFKYSSLKLFLSFSPIEPIISADVIYSSLKDRIRVSTC